jgi:hypothetical protein
MTALQDIAAGWRLRGDGAPVNFSGHALERYRERIRPEMTDDEQVRSELSKLLGTAIVTRERPGWVRPGTGAKPAAYLVLADSICLPLVASGGELIATSTLLAHMVEGATRERRNAAGQRRRAGRRDQRNAAKRGRPRPRPSIDEQVTADEEGTHDDN